MAFMFWYFLCHRNEDCIRIERLDEAEFDYSQSLKRVCALFEDEEERIKHISELPSSVVSCLGATLVYLAEFKLDRIIKMAGYVYLYFYFAPHSEVHISFA